MRLRPLSLSLLTILTLGAEAPDPAEAPVRAHMAFLADGLLEGRGTGLRGGALAVRYLETQLQALGLQPLADGSFRQGVPVAGMRMKSESRITFGGWTVHPGRDAAFTLSTPAEALAFTGEVVFVGHGITAKDGSRDDYRGLDVRGKLLIALVGDRPDTQAKSPGCSPENWYGRWAYKFEEAARHGAAGMLLIHTEASASYKWDVVEAGWLGERYAPGAAAGPARVIGWIREGAARDLFHQAGQDLDRLVAAAHRPDFRPVSLGLKAEADLKATVRRFTEYNVAGLVPGTDPALAGEAVITSAHWDHLGPAPDGDCFHGAVDNASACGATLALAAEVVQRPTRRSQIFLFPCGEEQGMLGSEAWVRSPLWPLAKTVAVLNLESLNVVGPTRDIGLRGARQSGLWEASVAAAKAVGLLPAPEAPDRPGLYFRSDHWPFVRAGVAAFSPGFSLDGGWDYVGDREAQQARAAAFNRQHYHRTSDRYDPAWDLRGLIQQLRFAERLMRDLGNGASRPVVTQAFR